MKKKFFAILIVCCALYYLYHKGQDSQSQQDQETATEDEGKQTAYQKLLAQIELDNRRASAIDAVDELEAKFAWGIPDISAWNAIAKIPEDLWGNVQEQFKEYGETYSQNFDNALWWSSEPFCTGFHHSSFRFIKKALYERRKWDDKQYKPL